MSNDKTSKTKNISNATGIGRRRFVSYLLSSAAVFAFAAYFWKDSYRFRINKQIIKLKGLTKPIRVAHLSDFHYGKFIKEADLEKWIDAVLKEKPELVLITGDLIDSSTTELAGLIRQLKRLRVTHGVWAIWGNHDYKSHGNLQSNLLKELNSIGVNVLVNQGTIIRDDIYLVGTDDLYNGRPDINLALTNRPDNTLCFHMTHNPDYLFNTPGSVDFSFCGHTHGGQVRLPLIGAPYIPSAYGDKFIGGIVADPVNAFVSKGLGFTALPIRLNARAEIVILDFLPSWQA